MAEILAHLPPAHLLPAGHFGAPGQGVRAAMVESGAAATLVARRGAGPALAAAFAAAGLDLPQGPKATHASGLTVVGTGPGRYLVLAEAARPAELLARLTPLAQGCAALADQSDANILLDISGPKARAALAKGVMIDLHPAAFAVGDAATTVVAHVGVTFWQADAAPLYRFAVPRSFAPAFLRFLAANAAEYGFTLSGSQTSGSEASDPEAPGIRRG